MDHDHVPALSALLLSAPLAVLAFAAMQLAAPRWTAARIAVELAARTPPASKLVALLLMTTGVIHLGLVPGHLDEPLLVLAFAFAGIGLIGLAGATLVRLPYWRVLSATALVAVLVAYSTIRVAGIEGVDALGLATAAIELATLWIVLRRGSSSPAWTSSRPDFGKIWWTRGDSNP